jgi:diacylglycerol kinase family enzyme
MKVAVVAHSGKTLGGGLSELHGALVAAGVPDPLWYEVDKSRKAGKRVKKALKEGADLLFVWGGDGMVQHCIDAAAGSKAALAIVPAGTANLLASNLGVPKDITQCVDIGLHGGRRKLDVGHINGERFAVMAGVGLDALMIREAGKGLKARIGRLAYVWTGAKELGAAQFGAKVKVDGKPWFKGDVACVLLGNVGSAFGGVTLFKEAQPDDGRLEVGVVTAEGALEWSRTIARTMSHHAGRSPFVQFASGQKITIKLDHPVAYELDGGARHATDKLHVRVEPGALTVCVPGGPAMGRHPG